MKKKTMTALDGFGLFAGIIGLIVDVLGLGGILIATSTGEEEQFFLWLILFLSAFYSTALVSFFTRKHLYSKYRQQIGDYNQRIRQEKIVIRGTKSSKNERTRDSIIRKIERGVLSATHLVAIPIYICLASSVAYVDYTNRMLSSFFTILIAPNRLEYTLFGGFFYGSVIAFFISWMIHQLVLTIFIALESEYGRTPP